MKEHTDDSPFWLYIAENNGVQSERIKAKLKELSAVETHFMKYTDDNLPPTLYDSKKGDFYLLALHPLVHATLDEVADDMMKQVLEWIDYIKT